MAKKRKKKVISAFSKAMKGKKLKGKKLSGLQPKKKRPRIDPLWTLEDGITYSILSSFLVCRHRFHIDKIQGWKPKSFRLPLEFGNIFHLMVEAQDRGIPTELLVKIASNYVERKANEQSLDGDTMMELSMLAGIVTVTFQQYVKFWEKHASLEVGGKHYKEKNFHWLEKEKKFGPATNSKVSYTLPNGRKLNLAGIMDGVFLLQKSKPGRWVLETKTKGQIDEEGISLGLHKDMQTGIYLVCDQILNNGVLPKGVLYNVIRRTGSKPRMGRGKSKTGKENIKEFVDRVEADIIKRPEYYFYRWKREVSAQELENFKRRQLNPALYQLCTWWDSIKNAPMKPWVTVGKCDACDGEGDVVSKRNSKGKKTGVYLPATVLNIKNYVTGGGDLAECDNCNGQGKLLMDNPYHYERAFGSYDGMSYTQRGDFFPIITDDNYQLYEQELNPHPEFIDDPLEQYLDGVE